MADASDKGNSTRAHIKKTFLSLYKKKPLNAIFVSDLVKECNISRGTFYFHFENIEQVYRACEQDLIDKMEDGLDKVVLCTVGGSRRDMARHIETYSKHLARFPQFQEVCVCLLKGSERGTFMRRWVESIYRHFAQSLAFSKNVSPIQQEFLIHFYSGGEAAMLSNWVMGGCAVPPEEVAAVSAQVLFQGVFLTGE